MLGLNGYEKNIEIFELCLLNKCSEALKTYDSIIQNGVQPSQVISNLLEICHLASKMNVIKEEASENDHFQKRISNLATNNLTKLVNFWQILIKSIEEIRYAPNQDQAGSMAIIKLCYGALLPDPSTLLKKLSNSQGSNQESDNVANDSVLKINEQKKSNEEFNNLNKDQDTPHKNPESFEEMLEMLLIHKELLLHAQIINNIHLVSFSKGFIKVRLNTNSDINIPKNLSSTLEKLTNNKWVVSISEEEGEQTVAEKESMKLDERKNEIKNNPEFSEVFKHFPDAKIISIEDKN